MRFCHRQIKFRVWDLCEKKMHEIVTFQNIIMSQNWSRVMRFSASKNDLNEVDTLGADDERNADKIIIMQYTGLKDKNGREIFEGDIVYCHECLFNSEINWMPEASMFSFHRPNVHDNYIVSEILHEVIGNIYQSPELLKK